jgi:hypothetical protein
MPAAARKSADAAPAATPEDPQAEPAAAAEPQTPVAEETPAEAPAEGVFRPAVTVTFNGQAQSAVAGVGLCNPGERYTVGAAVADALCRGESPLFTRAVAA